MAAREIPQLQLGHGRVAGAEGRDRVERPLEIQDGPLDTVRICVQ